MKVILLLLCTMLFGVAYSQDSSSISRFTFLNAASFDFTGPLSNTSYLGHVNLFSPSRISIGDNFKFGFNVGIMKISINSTDTTKDVFIKENTIINPLEPPTKNGQKYLNQINKYSTASTNTAWSFYVQPLFRLNNDEKNGIFFHLHAELLVNKRSFTTTITNVKQDTGTVSNINTFTARAMLSNISTSNYTIYNGYFGAGITFNLTDLGLDGLSCLYISPTFGFTSNYPTQNSFNNIPHAVGTPGLNTFYHIRSYLLLHLSDNVGLTLGTEIRGLFPQYDPQYAAYLGLNLKLEALKDLLSSSH